MHLGLSFVGIRGLQTIGIASVPLFVWLGAVPAHDAPDIMLHDKRTLPHRLVTKQFGISKDQLLVGCSMGTQQTNQWRCLDLAMLERIAAFVARPRPRPTSSWGLRARRPRCSTLWPSTVARPTAR